MQPNEFIEKQLRDRKRIRDRSKELNSPLFEARSLALSFLLAQQLRVQGKKYRVSDSRMDRLALYIQGADLSFSAIVEGLYAQASALQRQELEQITAMEEELRGNRRDGRSANVHNTWSKFGSEYKKLSNGAHLGSSELVAQLASYKFEDKSGPTVAPQFRQDFCRSMLHNHVLYLLHACRHAVVVFSDTFGTEPPQNEYESIYRAVELLGVKADK